MSLGVSGTQGFTVFFMRWIYPAHNLVVKGSNRMVAPEQDNLCGLTRGLPLNANIVTDQHLFFKKVRFRWQGLYRSWKSMEGPRI